MSTAVKPRIDVRKLAFLGMLTAIIFVMAFTPLGYLRTGGLSITFLLIPVAMGAVLCGPSAGACLGGVFGLTSFIQCFGMEAFGSTLLGINPAFTFLTCMVPRILTGLLVGFIFRGLQKIDKTRLLSYAGACLSGALLNTLMFMTCLVLFFWNTEFIQGISASFGSTNVFAFVAAFVGINGVIEAVSCFLLGTALTKALSVLGAMIARKRYTGFFTRPIGQRIFIQQRPGTWIPGRCSIILPAFFAPRYIPGIPPGWSAPRPDGSRPACAPCSSGRIFSHGMQGCFSALQ